MKRTTLLVAVAVAVIAAVLVARRTGLFGGLAAPTIRIGAVVPLTGRDAAVGIGMRDSMRLAIDQVNARGGIQGRKVELVPLDEDPDRAKTAEHVKQLVDDPSVLAASGHYREEWQLFAGELYHSGQLANLIAGALETEQTTDMLRWSPEFFRVVPTNRAQAKQARQYAWEIAGARKFLIVHDESYFALRMFDVVRQEMLHYLPLMPDDLEVLATERDFKKVVERIQRDGSDYIFFAGEAEQAAALLSQLRAAGITATFHFASKYPSDELVRLAGAKLAEGVVTTFAGLPPEDTAGGKAFLRDFAAAGSKESPGPYGLYAYAGMQALLAAIERSSLTRPSVVKELRLGQFETALGPIRFVWKGQSSYNRIAIYKVTGGKWKPIFVTEPPGPSGPSQRLEPVAAR